MEKAKATPDPYLSRRAAELQAFARNMSEEVDRRTPAAVMGSAQSAALNNPRSLDLLVEINNHLTAKPAFVMFAVSPYDNEDHIAISLTATIVFSGLTGVPNLFAVLAELYDIDKAIEDLRREVDLDLNNVRVVLSPELKARWGRRGYQRWEAGRLYS